MFNDICKVCGGSNTITNSVGSTKCLDCHYFITRNFYISRSVTNVLAEQYGFNIKIGDPDYFLIEPDTQSLRKSIRQMPMDKKREIGLSELRLGFN